MAGTFTRKADFGYKAGSRSGAIHRIRECEAYPTVDGLRFEATWQCGRRCYGVALVADWTQFARRTCDECEVEYTSEYCYFALRRNLVKVGYTRNLDRRMRELDASLLAAIPGSRETERILHRALKESWVVGEWFRLDSEVYRLLDDLHGDGLVVAGRLADVA